MRKTLVALVTAAAVCTSGCSWLSSEANKAKDTVIDCAKADLGQQVTLGDATVSILLAVVGTIAQGGLDWRADLAALEKKFGPDVVACAAHVAQELFTGSLSAGSASVSTADMPDSPAARAAQYLSGKKFK